MLENVELKYVKFIVSLPEECGTCPCFVPLSQKCFVENLYMCRFVMPCLAVILLHNN
jgi:hypothetical protein